MRVDVKGHFLTTKHIWFESFDDLADAPKADNTIIHMNESNIAQGNLHCTARLFTSLESDLRGDPENWGINKYHRQKARRSEREGTELLCLPKRELSQK